MDDFPPLDLMKQLVGSCSCMTKTPDPKFHDPLCYTRLLWEKETVSADLCNKLSPIVTYLDIIKRDKISQGMKDDCRNDALQAVEDIITIIANLERRL